LTSKKASLDGTPDQAQSRRNHGKTVRRSLVEASVAQDAALLARELRTSQTQQELAVIVVVEFTGELRKRKQLTASRAQCDNPTQILTVGEQEIAIAVNDNLGL
jgi:GTP-binding protein HflX